MSEASPRYLGLAASGELGRCACAAFHVRAEVPFFTGPRVPVAELVAALP